MSFKYLSILFIFITFSCTSQDLINISIGSENLFVEIASTNETRAKGLMNRDRLNDNSGMIFVFDKENSVSFWMKNTSIPLSLAYINKKGVIMEIYLMTPFSLEPISSRRSSVKYALEVNAGYFKNNGIKVGDILELEALIHYLKSSK